MTAQPNEPVAARPVISAFVQPHPQEVDASCRMPLLFMITSSVLWLVVSFLFAILANIKSHAPGMLADVASLTFGRVAGVASSAFYYGFASQAAIAISLWLVARMGRTLLVLPRAGLVAAIFWNLLVLIGVFGILAGGMTHFPAFEMPASTNLGLFACYCVLGISALLTFNARTEREIYPAAWFLIAAFLVFPWIYSTAALMLGHYPTRGVMEPIISTWFYNNFIALWLGPIALAVIFYFVSKLSGQPLYSRALATFAFWFYVLFAHGGGFQNYHALPNWMPNLSRVLNGLMLIPVAALAWNWYQTWAGHNRQKKQKDISSKYLVFSAFAFVASGLFTALVSCPAFDRVLGFSLFIPGLTQLTIYGFIAMALFAAIYHIVPRLTEVDWPKPKFVSLHASLTIAGIILSAGALLFGGYVHGSAMNDPSMPMLDVIRKRAVPFIGTSTIGLLLLFAAQLLLLANLLSMLRYYCATGCGWGNDREVAR